MQTFNVSIDFITAALDARFEDKKDLWGNTASIDLWDNILDMITDCGIGEGCNSPSEFVDNYLINGEFITRDGLSANDARSYGIELDDDGTVSDEAWSTFCDECVVSNNDYACRQF